MCTPYLRKIWEKEQKWIRSNFKASWIFPTVKEMYFVWVYFMSEVTMVMTDFETNWIMIWYLQVSWVRHRDIHLLTVGRYTYTSDQRFEAMHSPHTEEWTLRIRYAQRKDSGELSLLLSMLSVISNENNLNLFLLISFKVFMNVR